MHWNTESEVIWLPQINERNASTGSKHPAVGPLPDQTARSARHYRSPQRFDRKIAGPAQYPRIPPVYSGSPRHSRATTRSPVAPSSTSNLHGRHIVPVKQHWGFETKYSERRAPRTNPQSVRPVSAMASKLKPRLPHARIADPAQSVSLSRYLRACNGGR